MLFTMVTTFGQEAEIERIQHEGKAYWLYPERQRVTFNPTALVWDKEIRLSRQELRQYKWRDRRFFRKDWIAVKFPEDGEWIQLFDSDQFLVAKRFTVVDGLPNGNFKRYNKFGDVVEEGSYRNGNRYGQFFFYPDSASYHREYATGNYDMPNSTYYKVAFFPYYHIADEGKHGVWEYRKADSSLYSIETYRYGDRHGPTYRYHADGTPRHERHYKNDELAGVQIEWFKNGQMCEQSTYQQGLREGAFQSWYPDGKEKCQLQYSGDQIIDGKCTLFYEDGAKFGEGWLEGGTRLGPWTFWHENGALKAQGSYEEHVTDVCMSGMARPYLHSVQAGEWCYWYPEGQVLAQGVYRGVEKQISRGQIFVDEMVVDSWSCQDETGKEVPCEVVSELLELEEE